VLFCASRGSSYTRLIRGEAGAWSLPAAGCKYSIPPRFRPPVGVRSAAAPHPAGPGRLLRPRPRADRAPAAGPPAICSPIPGAAFPNGSARGILTLGDPGAPANPRHDARAEHGLAGGGVVEPVQRAGLADGQAVRHLGKRLRRHRRGAGGSRFRVDHCCEFQAKFWREDASEGIHWYRGTLCSIQHGLLRCSDAVVCCGDLPSFYLTR